MYMHTKTKKCPYCGNTHVVKRGMRNRVQRWWCRGCDKRFVQHRDQSIDIFIDYVFHKQTLRELVLTYDSDIRIVQKILSKYVVPDKIHSPREVHIMVDALRFGSRGRENEWCLVVFRDFLTKENIWWGYSIHEERTIYQTGREVIEQLGYRILSVTADGFSGIRSVFNDIAFQMCHVHMERLVVKGTTRNPKLEAGTVLLALTKSLHDTGMTEELFRNRLLTYKDRYFDFLQEKSESLTTGEWWYTHEGLRQAFNSLYIFFPYLFTYKHNSMIPRTTNSLEGHFSHVRDIIHIHRSLSKEKAQKILNAIMLCSTIAPTEEMVKKLFR